MKPLKILSFNIHGGYSLDGKRDLNRIYNLLNELDIDIAVFQEMETRSSRGGAEEDVAALCGDERPHHLMGATMKDNAGGGWYGNLLVSRFPLLRGKVHSLEKKWLEPRNAIDCLIETPLGRLRILGTHLSLPAWERKVEVPKLIDLVADVEAEEKYPVFLMGDMNEWRPRSRLLDFLNEKLIAVPAGPSFPAFMPILKLDRVWHDTPGLNAHAQTLSGYGVRKMSDHLPVLIEVADLGPDAAA